jgi:L-fuconolactonase
MDHDDADVRQRKQMFELSRFPNVFMKVGGVGETAGRVHRFGEHEPVVSIPPYHVMAYEAFGADRLMWASDFPPVSHREGYERSFTSCAQQFIELSEEDRCFIFGETASRLYFPDPKMNP